MYFSCGTTRLSDYPWGYLRKDGLSVGKDTLASTFPQGLLYPDNHYLIHTHLKVLRMGAQEGMDQQAQHPLQPAPIMLPVVGPSWGPFHLSMKPPRAPHLRASRPGSAGCQAFVPGLAWPPSLMPLSPPPPLRPRFPDPLPVSSSGTGGSEGLWGWG